MVQNNFIYNQLKHSKLHCSKIIIIAHSKKYFISPLKKLNKKITDYIHKCLSITYLMCYFLFTFLKRLIHYSFKRVIIVIFDQ